MPAVNIDIGIGECVRTLDIIAARRAKRKENYFSNFSDDLDAVSKIVKTLDNLFIKLVLGFKNPNITTDQAALSTHLEETKKYLASRELLPRLQDLTAELEVIAAQKKIKKNRELAASLDSLINLLKRYRDRLGKGIITGVGQTEEWNLMTLCERAQGSSRNIHFPLTQMAEQVHQNQDFELSDAIHKAVGKVRGLARSDLAFRGDR